MYTIEKTAYAFTIKKNGKVISYNLRFASFFIKEDEIKKFVESYEGKDVVQALQNFDSQKFEENNFSIEEVELSELLAGLEGIEKKLVFLNWLNRKLQLKKLQQTILVGGSAVEFWTTSDVKSYDIDIIYGNLENIFVILKDFGFYKDSRYLVNDELDLVLESPSDTLEAKKQPIKVKLNGKESSVLIISLEDIIIDRLEQASVGNKECLGHAIKMILANKDILDKKFIVERTKELGIENLLPDNILYERRGSI